MAIRPVLRLPNPALRYACQPVGRVDDIARDLAADLLETMKASPACVGLAANQIGSRQRALVVDVTGHRKARTCHGAIVLFDARLVEASVPIVAREGCMSVPALTGDVARADQVTVAGLALDGSPLVITTDAFEARALQHEIDHLDGHVFLDRVLSPEALFTRKVYRR